jgi:hypothetical protein
LNLTATAATGGSGTLTYKVYTKAGTFSAASVTAVEAEGTLFTTTTSVTSAIALTGLTGNTSYQLATIVSDTLGTKALYTPITQATADARLVFRLAAPNGNLGGTTGADAICQASRPTGITTAKALLVDGNNRIACTTANCGGGPGEHLDWVLAASAAYRNEAGSAVGTTTANGIFSFSMTAGLSAAGGEWFNGFSSAKNWTAANSDCTNFSTTGGVGNVGDAGSTSNSSLSIYDQNCNRTDVYLICVEQ